MYILDFVHLEWEYVFWLPFWTERGGWWEECEHKLLIHSLDMTSITTNIIYIRLRYWCPPINSTFTTGHSHVLKNRQMYIYTLNYREKKIISCPQQHGIVQLVKMAQYYSFCYFNVSPQFQFCGKCSELVMFRYNI